MVWLPALVASPASATDYSYDTSVRLSAAPSATVAYETPVSLEGAVTFDPDPSTPELMALTGAEVTLWREWRGQVTWTQVTTATTDATGAYEFDVTATRNATYKVTFAGGTATDTTSGDTVTYSASQATKNIWVSRKLNDTTTNPAPHRYYLKGNVDPGWGNKAVYLQRKTCKGCAWKNYAKQTTTSAGAFRFRLDFPTRVGPTWYYRVKVPSSQEYISSYSNAYYVTLI